MQFSRLSSSHMSLLRLVERKLKTGFGNEWSSQRLSLSGSSLTLHGPSVVILCAGEAIANLVFHEAHMELHGRAFQANIFIVDMVFLGGTRSAKELAVFTKMTPERLCLGCGLRVDEKFTPSSLVNGDHYLLRL